MNRSSLRAEILPFLSESVKGKGKIFFWNLFLCRMVGLQGENRVFVKRIMIMQARLEDLAYSYAGNNSVIGGLFQRVIQEGDRGLSWCDALGSEYMLYWTGRAVFSWGLSIPYRRIKGMCQWAFTKSSAELVVIARAQTIENASVRTGTEQGSIRRLKRLTRATPRLEQVSLEREDFIRVALRGLIVYYVAWCTAALVSQLLLPFCSETPT